MKVREIDIDFTQAKLLGEIALSSLKPTGELRMLPYRIEPLFTYHLQVAPPQVLGPVPGDVRLDFGFVGGEVSGPRLRGKVRPGGTDSATLRTDGVILVDVRGLLESHDGALIEITYTGMIDLGTEGYAGFLEGRIPPTLDVRAAPRFRTAHPGYAWLNRLQCVSIGQADMATLLVRFDVYGLS